jgi:hypothetical protein
MLVTPAIGGVIVAALAIGHTDLHGYMRWLTVALLAGPAVLAQARHTARSHGDSWISALAFLATGTGFMIAVAWAAGLISALATVATWMFFQDPAFMNQVVSAVIVGTALVSIVMWGRRWMGTNSQTEA